MSTPRTFNGDLKNPPPALSPMCAETHWVGWKWVPGKNGKWTKPPYRADRPESLAANDNPRTWGSYQHAIDAVLAGKLDGVGYVLTGTKIGAVDLDNCRDPQTASIDTWAQNIFDRAPDAYREVTVSGRGLRIIGTTNGAETHRRFAIAGARKDAAVELYRGATRYITVSGNEIGRCSRLPNIDGLIDAILIERENGGGNGFDFNPDSATTSATDGGDDIEDLIKNGAPEPTRSEKFSRVVWSLARQGFSIDQIDKRLRQHPRGIAEKFWPHRLRKEIERCHSKWRQAQGREEPAPPPAADAVTLDDFFAYMPMHQYIFANSRELWPVSSVNARLPAVKVGLKTVSASAWLDQNRPVEQMTWAPSEPMLIKNRLISEGGWLEHTGCTVFNLYRGPAIAAGNPNRIQPWIEHLDRIYPDHSEHITRWLAHRVQHPGDKINHALVLGGPQGIGKDTLLEPVRYAVGPWNFCEVAPQHLLGRFNGYVKSVILRVSEARDLGDVNRYAFYDHMKIYTAARPDVLRCDEKNLREYSVPNVCGVVITSNHKTDGIYLPADDRRHFVAWCDLTKEDFERDYWNTLYGWYQREGYRNVAAYLAQVDLDEFDPKAPPPHTAAFHAIVDANRAPEDAELADTLDALTSIRGQPADSITLQMLIAHACSEGFAEWLRDRKNCKAIPHRLEDAGYVPVRNNIAADGLWRINNKRMVVYARRELSVRQRLEAVEQLTARQ